MSAHAAVLCAIPPWQNTEIWDKRWREEEGGSEAGRNEEMKEKESKTWEFRFCNLELHSCQLLVNNTVKITTQQRCNHNAWPTIASAPFNLKFGSGRLGVTGVSSGSNLQQLADSLMNRWTENQSAAMLIIKKITLFFKLNCQMFADDRKLSIFGFWTVDLNASDDVRSILHLCTTG